MPDNQAPVTAADTASVLEGVSGSELLLQGNLLTNDSDPEGGALTLTSITYNGVTHTLTNGFVDFTTAYGRLYVGFTGAYYFFPNNQNAAVNALAPGESLAETFTYTVRDAAGATADSTLSLTIEGADDPPTFSSSSAWLADSGLTMRLNLFYNGRDPEGEALSVINVTGLQPGMSIDYTTNELVIDLDNPLYKSIPLGGGADWVVNFQVTDGTQVTNGAYRVHVYGLNDAPAAPDIHVPTVLTEGGESITVDALQNASDVDAGTVLTVVAGQYGSAFKYDAATHSFTIDPSDPYFNFLRGGVPTTMGLQFNVSDGITQTPSIMWFTITGVNDAPTARADVATVREQGVGTGLGSVVGNLSANDSDPDSGDNRSIIAFGQGDHTAAAGQTFSGTYGSLWVRSDGVYIYQLFDNAGAVNGLKAGETLTETFFYTTSDSGGLTSTSTLTVTINGTNDAPRVQFNLLLTGSEGEAGESFDARLFVSDAEGDALTVVNLPAVLAPGLTFDAATQNFTFDPTDPAYDHLPAGAIYQTIITYGVSDGAASANQRLTVRVTGVNDAPVAPDLDGGEAAEGSALLTLDALQGASDVDDGAVLSIVAPEELPDGVSCEDGVFTLDPSDAAFDHLAAGASQTVSVSFGVTDGTATVARTASWVVTGVNDAPVAQDDAVSTTEKQSVTIPVLGNDTDADAGDTLSLVSASGSAHGSTIALSGGSIVFTPGAAYDLLTHGETATETFIYTVRDAAGVESTATVTVTIDGASDGRTVLGSNKSDVLPGTGDDEQILGGNGEDVLNGLGGADRLFGDNGKDSLQGGDGFDRLDGGNGADVLDGGGGDDTLTGGEGPDLFVFSFGDDVVTDFDNNDRIQISQGLAADFEALKSHISQDGADAVITVGDATITLTGVQASSLFAGDFVFV